MATAKISKDQTKRSRSGHPDLLDMKVIFRDSNRRSAYARRLIARGFGNFK